MKVIRDCKDYHGAESAVTLGKFDGVHRGHQRLLQAVSDARKDGLEAVAFTFTQSPKAVLAEHPVPVLSTEQEKLLLLERAGIEDCVLFPFTQETAKMEAEEFIQKILVNSLHAKRVVVGADFRFGRGRQGNVTLLKSCAAAFGYQVEVQEELCYAGEKISSTRIAAAIKEGRMTEAARMLGRPYGFTGPVIHGRHLGHTIGVPTINLEIPAGKAVPPYGVYVSQTWLDGTRYGGITNIGWKPTVQKEPICGVETYLFDCQGDFYGKEAEVQLLSHTRPEIPFSSLQELKQQLNKDIADGRAYLSRM